MTIPDYQYLVGKEKMEIIEELGTEFNYYHSVIWSYHIKTGWFGRKYYLLLFFKDEVVTKVRLKKKYAKPKY